MQDVTATLDNDTAGELGALAAAHGFTPDVLAAAFIVEGIQRHLRPLNAPGLLGVHVNDGAEGKAI